MRREWIVDVLADLKAFAEHNGMDATAAGLEDAALVAVAEISSLTDQFMVAGLEPGAAGPSYEGGNVTDFLAYRGRG